MIVDAVISIFSNVISWIMGLIQLPDPPEFFATMGTYLSKAAGFFANTGAWIPWTLLAAVIAAWGITLLAGVAVKGLRVVASFLTAGGGSAA